MGTHYVGKRVPRVDALEKVTGQAMYSVDVELPGMLYGAALRSPLAHAKIVEIDTSAAWTVRGVRAVVTGKDFPFTFGHMIKDQPFLSINKVRHVGEPVATVAAETEASAQEAAERIRVEYEELPAVFDPREAALEGAPIIHEDLGKYDHAPIYEIVPGTNISTVLKYSRGDVGVGFSEADEVFEDEFYIHPVAHTPMETHAAVAQYAPSGKMLTVWSSVDAPSQRAKDLSNVLGLSFNQVRFISTYSGGGFGGKGAIVAEGIGVALAHFTKGRPVKVVYSRQEELTASQVRLEAFLKLKTGVKKDGTLTAREAEIILDNGAYSSKGPEVARRGTLAIFGPYRTPHIALLSRLIYTNKQPSGAYRGFGTSQVTWACESQMDIIAEKLGINPVEIRLRNFYADGDPYINGQIVDTAGLRETFEEATREVGWGQKKPKTRGTKVRGTGIATTMKGTSTPTDSFCFIKVNVDGSVTVLTGSVEIGAGEKTVLAQIAADTIGVPLASIHIPNPDTCTTPFDFGVTSSRTTYHMGNAVSSAGQKVRQQILEAAGKALKTDPEHLTIAEGEILDRDAGTHMTLKELMAKKYGRKGGTIQGEGYFTPAGSSLIKAEPGTEWMSSIFWMWATQTAEVEVDTETGVVKVLRIVAAHDVGRAINPTGCEQQIEGAVIMGLSNTLFEEFRMERGRIMNDTLADYKVATTLDFPEIVPIIIESHHSEGPFGAKGVGEPALAPTAPAIANALFDAVGIRFKSLPITREKVLAALKKRNL